MSAFETKRLTATRDVMALDGPDVRVLLGLAAGGMAVASALGGFLGGGV